MTEVLVALRKLIQNWRWSLTKGEKDPTTILADLAALEPPTEALEAVHHDVATFRKNPASQIISHVDSYMRNPSPLVPTVHPRLGFDCNG